MTEKLPFKPRARLLLQLGDELIRNESIALLELVKNAYDADATHVNLNMEKIDDIENGIIVVEDNGTGMDIETIKNSWMEPGSDRKAILVKGKKRTEKYNRLVLGEKGIGRFAAHKLGNLIELVTRKHGNKELYLTINWTDFEKAKYLDDVEIKVFEREPEVFTDDKTGTRITVRKIRVPWTRGMVREVYRSWNSLCSPFSAPDSFSIDFQTDKQKWLDNLIKLEDIKNHALFSFSCEIKGQYVTKFSYKFEPWKTMKKLRKREISEKNEGVKKMLKIVDEKSINLVSDIGTMTFEGLIFDRDAKILSLGVADKKGFTEYLDSNGGIKVYRDGIRIYDYGEPGNDWLGLDIRRINIPAMRISNNIIIAAVSLKRKTSSALIEKTNREGFITNQAYESFKQSILHAIHLVEVQRNEDKSRLRKLYGPTPKYEPVISKIDALKKTVSKKIKNKPLKIQITKSLDRIEYDYRYILETLLRSAGAGLNLSVVIHEIEKIIGEINKVIEKEDIPERFSKLVEHLSRLVEGYTLLIRKSDRKEWNIQTITEQAIFNMEFRFKAHKIEIVKGKISEEKVNCARNLVVATIMNILDNSIWWLNYGETRTKKIFIEISKDLPGYTSLVIADNGPGFTLPVETITAPFVTGKPAGMGLGLHIASEVMKAHGGQTIFPDWGDFEIPSEFKKGATVVLAFKNEAKK